ncbi:MAG: hypothetical protein KatS3mg055_3693 [Chloroflexus sp.]|uniref:DUF1998 domain-containing protein n=1 Tax=Chloroflexus sp. TaxID=1904827 RepID=UPI0021DDC7BC|nr:DUF1998 domain-containing protein [Chloroflexus sp.]GIV91175.1 MAG: hypothetical protein KatS3mg055_3693 [Chloroflexus sp.]
MQSADDALALAASYHLDADPVELSAGYRFLPEYGQVALFLVDTASGDAGFATEVGRQINQIRQATLRLVEECPANVNGHVRSVSATTVIAYDVRSSIAGWQRSYFVI